MFASVLFSRFGVSDKISCEVWPCLKSENIALVVMGINTILLSLYNLKFSEKYPFMLDNSEKLNCQLRFQSCEVPPL